MELRQTVELGSYVQAARNFSELNGVQFSGSSLQRLVMEYGMEVVVADENKADTLVCEPKDEEG